MKVELYSFSGYKSNPGLERCYAMTNAKVFQILNAKCKVVSLSKKKLQQLNWTVLCRRKHEKGQSEEIFKKGELVKFQRAITGALLAELMAKRDQKPKVKKGSRGTRYQAFKEIKKAKRLYKKIAMAAAMAPPKAEPKQMILKSVRVSAPWVGGKR